MCLFTGPYKIVCVKSKHLETCQTALFFVSWPGSGLHLLLMLFIMVFLWQSSAWRSPFILRLYMLTTAEIRDNCMARLGHEHMAVHSKSSSAWQLISSRKVCAKWCINTIPYWPIRLRDSWRWERLISSQQVIDLSTACNINNQTQRAKVIGPYL